jgi:hypothetical protein
MASIAQPDPDESSTESLGAILGLRNGLSRRRFLGRGSLVAGAAAAMAAVPGLGALMSAGEADAPAVTGTAGTAATEVGSGTLADVSEPVVAHVVNASTGEINLYQGAQQITTRNPALAQALVRLAASK